MDFNIFEGLECHGVPVVVISQGRVVVDHGKVNHATYTHTHTPSPCCVCRWMLFVGVVAIFPVLPTRTLSTREYSREIVCVCLRLWRESLTQDQSYNYLPSRKPGYMRYCLLGIINKRTIITFTLDVIF